LRAIGLPELITANLPDYESLALKLATDERLLGEVRAKVARNRTTYPLFDTDRFRRHMESAYETVWRIWQAGEPPRPVKVKAVR
jgi:predicted O-linked N-acetylglucosamine transferase (SPINDLY family)